METVCDSMCWVFTLKQRKHKSFPICLILNDVEKCECFMVQDSYKTLEDYDKENKYLNIS